MNFAISLLDAREMGEADRPTVLGGVSASRLSENAGGDVAREVIRRLPSTHSKTIRGCGSPRGLERSGFLR